MSTKLQTHSSHSIPTPSDLPHQGYLSSSLALSNCSSLCCNLANISPFDLPSFTTDQQQQWLSQPQSPRLPRPISTTTAPTNHQDQDFVLFPSTADLDNTRPAPKLSSNVLPRETSHTLLNQATRSASYSPNQPSLQNHQRISAHQLSTSPIPNPLVTGLIGSSTSSPLQIPKSVASLHTRRLNSLPTSTAATSTATQRDLLQARPPVPLFGSTSTKDQVMAQVSYSVFEGNTSCSSMNAISVHSRLTSSSLDTDNMALKFTDFTSSSPVGEPSFFDEPLDFGPESSFETLHDQAISTETSPQTVSPRDIFLDASAPPSTTMTNLTTPGTNIYESPAGAYSTETSPLFGEDEIEGGAKHWPSLFEPIEEQPASKAMTHTISNSSSSVKAPASDSSPALPNVSPAPRMSRNNSSPGQGNSKSGRHSFTSGVGARRREKPLPPITVEDPSDSVAIKRARNTLAARKSRQKRFERTEALESEIAALQAEVDHWKAVARAHGHGEE